MPCRTEIDVGAERGEFLIAKLRNLCKISNIIFVFFHRFWNPDGGIPSILSLCKGMGVGKSWPWSIEEEWISNPTQVCPLSWDEDLLNTKRLWKANKEWVGIRRWQKAEWNFYRINNNNCSMVRWCWEDEWGSGWFHFDEETEAWCHNQEVIDGLYDDSAPHSLIPRRSCQGELAGYRDELAYLSSSSEAPRALDTSNFSHFEISRGFSIHVSI